MSDAQLRRRALMGFPIAPLAVVVFAGLAGVLSARGDAVRAQDSSGPELYAAHCAGCHQPAGEGLPGTFPPLAGNPAAADREYLAQVLAEGKSGPIEVLGVQYDAVMPPFDNLTAEEATAVVDHVVSLATGEPPATVPGTTPDSGLDETPATTVPPAPPSAGDADRGYDLFVGSNRLSAGATACASCHAAGDVGMVGGSGLGPDLTDVYGRLGGEAGLTAWLANPASPTMMPIFADRPLADDEIADLVAFMADAPDREAPSDSIDWLLVAGFTGLAALLAVMALALRQRRQPYAQTLAKKTATTARSLR